MDSLLTKKLRARAGKSLLEGIRDSTEKADLSREHRLFCLASWFLSRVPVRRGALGGDFEGHLLYVLHMKACDTRLMAKDNLDALHCRVKFDHCLLAFHDDERNGRML